jgi:ParB family chromosome partitioning protein
MTVKTHPLGKLVPSAKNVRRYKSDAGIESLAADISAKGLLQNLNVEPGKRKGVLEVIAGGRRLKALNHLLKTGGSITGVKVTKDYPVPVSEAVSDEVSATEISLSENFQRSAMHAADEIEAFGKLANEQGMTPEEIAARFGISHMTVRRRLKLANLSPRILEELREDRISLEQAEALSLSDDHSRQEEAWFEAKSWQREAFNLKARLSEGTLRPTDKIARFIGSEYRAAGGPIESDLFTPTEQAYLVDKDMAFRLANEKLEAQRETVQAEGWKWVEAMPDFDYSTSRNYGRVYAEEVPLTKKEQKRLDALTAEADKLGETLEEKDIYPDDEPEGLSEEDAALVTRYQDIQKEIEALNDRPCLWTDEQKAQAGAVVTIDYDGSLKVERGLIHPDDRVSPKPAKTQAVAGAASETQPQQEPESSGLSAALTEDLTAQRSAALAIEVAKRSDVALVTLVHALALQHFYRRYAYDRDGTQSAAQIKRELPPAASKDIEQAPVFVALSALEAKWKKQLPARSRDLWHWLMEESPKTVNELMAYLVGISINATQQRIESRHRRHENADRIAVAVGLDMTAHWHPDADFFRRTSKAYMAQAIIEAAGENYATVAKGLTKIGKAEAVSATVDAVTGRKWLPQPLKVLEAAPFHQDEPEEDEGDEIEDAEGELNEAA